MVFSMHSMSPTLVLTVEVNKRNQQQIKIEKTEFKTFKLCTTHAVTIKKLKRSNYNGHLEFAVRNMQNRMHKWKRHRDSGTFTIVD